MKQQGSIVVLVLIMFSAMVLICSKRWFAATLLLDTVLKKEQCEKQFWLVQGLLECGTLLCKKNWQELHAQLNKKKKKAVTLQVPDWPPFTGAPHYGKYRGELVITKMTEEKIVLQAHLLSEKGRVQGQSCVVTTVTASQTFFITDWKTL